MLVRAAALGLASLLGIFPACAYAFTPGVPGQVIKAAQITSLAERVARSLVPDPDRALAPAFDIADQNVPAGIIAITPGSPQINSTYVSFPIVIDIDDKPVRTVFAGFRITSYVRLLVAAHDLAPDTILSAGDLTYMRVPFNGRPGQDLDRLVGRKVRTSIARGESVFTELTAVNEIVRAGMPALLIVHDGPVSLAADVIARTGGGLGDYVTIFNPQTQKELSGVVTAPNTVELTLPGEK